MAGNVRTFIGQMRYWANLTNPGVGYDQIKRWDLRNGGSVDCSSFVIACLKIAGFHVGGATFTGNMRAELTKHGWVVKHNNGSPQAGDILLNDLDHTAAYLGHGLLAQASINEKGGATGGRPGDQTGQETNVHSYYNFPWDCYLRYEGPQSAPPPRRMQAGRQQAVPTIQLGSTGPRIRKLKQGLNDVFPLYSHLVVNDDFGPRAKAVVEEFQLRAGLTVTGVVDAETEASLHKYGVLF